MGRAMPIDRRAFLLTATALAACTQAPPAADAAPDAYASSPWRKLTAADWQARLPPDSFAVLRQAATEAPFSSPLNHEHRKGVFACLGCGLPLFKSEWKFDSGTGWPSFWAPINKTAVQVSTDNSLGMVRDEVHCSRCGGHLGHVFNDGPKPTGLRYCMNGLALGFRPTAV
jgi:peptide-methionine (R)-S-oxide reductase